MMNKEEELMRKCHIDYNERSIPSMVDGLRPIQRKILFGCFTRNLEEEVTVGQLVGSVAEMSGHHHDETSIASEIINLAQDFLGSNNINLLLPLGQFGSRLRGGEDSASPRYLFTKLSKIAQLIFNSKDDPVLNHLYESNRQIEPEWYAPIIPLVLVNGYNGIGTAWSTNIPNFNPKDVIGNIRRIINGQPVTKMHPWYRGFRGTIQQTNENSYQVYGEIGILGENLVAITELPIRNWTESYKQSVLKKLRNENLIAEYSDYSTDETVRFLVNMSPSGSAKAKTIGYHNLFRLQSTISMDNMDLYDEYGEIRNYNNAEDVLQSFGEVRLKIYKKRHHYMLGKLKAETSRLENQFRFITENISGAIKCENVKTTALIDSLKNGKYDSDPVESWKKSINDSGDTEDEEYEPDFTYLTSLPMLDLTKEQKNALHLKKENKLKELEEFKKKTPKQLWIDDLDQLEKELDVLFDEDHFENEDDSQLSVRVDPISKDMQQTAGRDIVVRINKNPNFQ